MDTDTKLRETIKVLMERLHELTHDPEKHLALLTELNRTLENLNAQLKEG